MPLTVDMPIKSKQFIENLANKIMGEEIIKVIRQNKSMPEKWEKNSDAINSKNRIGSILNLFLLVWASIPIAEPSGMFIALLLIILPIFSLDIELFKTMLAPDLPPQDLIWIGIFDSSIDAIDGILIMLLRLFGIYNSLIEPGLVIKSSPYLIDSKLPSYRDVTMPIEEDITRS